MNYKTCIFTPIKKNIMKVFNYMRDAIKYINETDLSDSDKICKIDNLLHNYITKIHGVIVILDEYRLLD